MLVRVGVIVGELLKAAVHGVIVCLLCRIQYRAGTKTIVIRIDSVSAPMTAAAGGIRSSASLPSPPEGYNPRSLSK